jgi:biotin carboxyl carrier protein
VIFELEVGDRLKTVEIRRHAGGYAVVVDGSSRVVDAVHIGGSAWSLLVSDAAGTRSRSVDAAVVKRVASIGYDVHINGFHFAVRPRAGLGRLNPGGGAHGGGPQRVTAPMPGKVVRVLVKPGDEVAARQGLVVVEAMKMENELRAASAGKVSDVLVREGQSVEAGAALVVVE